jgi:hypothetical protein
MIRLCLDDLRRGSDLADAVNSSSVSWILAEDLQHETPFDDGHFRSPADIGVPR